MRNWLKKEWVQTTLWILAILLLWEGSARLGLVNEYLLPSFSSVFIRMVLELTQSTLMLQVLNSFLVVIEGFAVSIALSLILTVLCTYFESIQSLCNALCTVLNPLPGLAVLPLIMIWFGVNTGAMLFLIVHGVLWPLLTNLIAGFRSVPSIYTDYAKNIGVSPISLVFEVLIYAIMPYFISGIRIGWGRAWRALVGAEMVFGMIGTLGGLGYYIYTNRAYGNITNVMAGVLVIVLIGMLVEKLFRWIEVRTVIKWGMSNE